MFSKIHIHFCLYAFHSYVLVHIIVKVKLTKALAVLHFLLRLEPTDVSLSVFEDFGREADGSKQHQNGTDSFSLTNLFIFN